MATERNRYVPDHRGIAAMLVGPEFKEFVTVKVEEAKTYAKAISPVSSKKSGNHYIDNFETPTPTIESLTKTHPTLRWAGDLVNTSRYAEAVESGWQKGIGRQPDHAGYHVMELTLHFIGDPREPFEL